MKKTILRKMTKTINNEEDYSKIKSIKNIQL